MYDLVVRFLLLVLVNKTPWRARQKRKNAKTQKCKNAKTQGLIALLIGRVNEP
jgi:hypothetical protein